MSFCDQQTLNDLELPILIHIMEEFCVGNTALKKIQELQPKTASDELLTELQHVKELVAIRREGLPFPRLEFEELLEEIKLLPVQNASLPQESFLRLKDASTLVNQLLFFFNKRELEFPTLNSLLAESFFTKDIIELIDRVFDKRGQIKDDASPNLFSIRQRIKSVQQQINRNFDRELRKWQKAGYLSDTRETYHENKRLLAVFSTNKRQVHGQISGSSKTGAVTYIEPQSNVPLNFELDQLFDDERKEIFIILRQLTHECSIHLPLIKRYQEILTDFDFINVKSKLALKLEAHLPAINEELHFELIDAYHPVLKLKNDEQGKRTIPQRIAMDKFSRMLVISGPNAGGKSITLKTVGILQLMLQSGLLVPIHPNSSMCFFQTLLTDIGDNQSIENELSTYSYRLTRMNYFLKVANRKTMLLLDEFGTGSDPELGGALAEVFFETLYNKKCFGVITTHYGNIKLKADQLQNAVNGCMLFDTNTLQPLYRFSTGQPGSSFTFEVAEINGIPKKLIELAKTKLDHKKVKMDRLLAELQKEKSYLSRLNKEHIEAQETAEKARLNFEESKKRLDEKLQTIRERAEQDSKLISLGQKFSQFIQQYKTRGKGKNVNADLLQEVKKYLAMEKAKLETAKNDERLVQAAKKAKKKPTNRPKKDPYQQAKIKLGSTVKMISTKQTGKVEEINDKEVTVSFGFMRLKVSKDKLLWVEN